MRKALDTVLDNERQLRAMLGMSIEDGTRLVPSDTPTIVEKRPDWEKALTEALKNRPELRIAREEIKLAEAKVWALERIGPSPGRWDCGPEDSNVVENKTDPSCMRCAAWDYIVPWNLIWWSLPRLQEAELQLRRTRQVLQDQELKTERFLGLYYRRMSSAYFQIKAGGGCPM